MIRKIRIRNFKSIEEAEIAVRPLTFLMGPNSGGKSSVIQPLLLLRQTVDSRDVENPLSIHGKYVDFGSYRDFIFQHNDRNHLGVDILFSAPLPIEAPRPAMLKEARRHPPLKISLSGTEILFSVEFRYIRKSMRVILHRALFSVPDMNAELQLDRADGDRYRAFGGKDIQGIEAEVLRLHKFYGASLGSPQLGKAVKAGKKAPKQERLERSFFEFYYFAATLSQQIERLFNKLFYIGPLREWPKRFYIATGETPQDVGLKGETAIDVLWTQSRRAATRKKTLSNINEWMKHFEMASEVTLRGIGSNTYELKLTDYRTNLPVNLADTGFGASQVFPIIVEGFYATSGSVLLIEQPEIHLHPRAQATLADLLVEIAIKGNKTLIVETHSEHLISRILRRIAEGKLKSEDVAIYYCEPTTEGTKVRDLRIKSYGQFEPESLPEGFFEEDYRESFEHLKAMLSRAR